MTTYTSVIQQLSTVLLFITLLHYQYMIKHARHENIEMEQRTVKKTWKAMWAPESEPWVAKVGLKQEKARNHQTHPTCLRHLISFLFFFVCFLVFQPSKPDKTSADPRSWIALECGATEKFSATGAYAQDVPFAVYSNFAFMQTELESGWFAIQTEADDLDPYGKKNLTKVCVTLRRLPD